MKLPLIIPNFLTASQCRRFVECITAEDNWFDNGNDKDPWNNRTKWPDQQVTDPEILIEFREVSERVKLEAVKYFEATEPIYAEMPHFVRWRTGDHLWPPHADKENADRSPHAMFWRDFGTVIYLNDDFEGGEIEYPLMNIKQKMPTGTLAVHLGTLDYLHGVRQITSGTRYTIASFLTHDKQYGYYDQRS